MQCLVKTRVVLPTCQQGLIHGGPCNRQMVASHATKDSSMPPEGKPRTRRASSRAAKQEEDEDEQPAVKPKRTYTRQAKSKERSIVDVDAEQVSRPTTSSTQQADNPIQYMGFSLANIKENAMRFFRAPAGQQETSKPASSSNQAAAVQQPTQAAPKAPKAREPSAPPAARRSAASKTAASRSPAEEPAPAPRQAKSSTPAAAAPRPQPQPVAARQAQVATPPLRSVSSRPPPSGPVTPQVAVRPREPSVPPAQTKLQAVQAAAKQATAAPMPGVSVRRPPGPPAQAEDPDSGSKLTVKQKFISVKEVLSAAKQLNTTDLGALKSRIDELKEGIDDLYYDATSERGPAELGHHSIKFSMQQQSPELDLLNQQVEEKVLLSCTVNGVKVTGQATNTSFFFLDGTYDSKQSSQSFRLGPLVVAYDLGSQKEICGGLEELRGMWGISPDDVCRLLGWILNTQLEMLDTKPLDERLSYHYQDYIPYTWYNFKYARPENN